MKPINASNDVSFLLDDILGEVLDELLTLFFLQHFEDIIYLYSDVGDSDHHTSAKALDSQETALLELVVQAEDPSAAGVEVASVLKQVETYQVTG